MTAETAKKIFPEGYLTCPVRRTLSVISGKWTLLILYELMERPRRFNALKRDLNGISQRLLTAQLKSLVEGGLVHREVHDVVPPHVEYSLTEKGHSLKPVIDALEIWGQAELDADAG
ncbi:MAG: transcriptional regulator [Rhodobacteraceae bacterium]|nr:transcriptional regulator [Paracoccaceae bacterium]